MNLKNALILLSAVLSDPGLVARDPRLLAVGARRILIIALEKSHERWNQDLDCVRYTHSLFPSLTARAGRSAALSGIASPIWRARLSWRLRVRARGIHAYSI